MEKEKKRTKKTFLDYILLMDSAGVWDYTYNWFNIAYWYLTLFLRSYVEFFHRKLLFDYMPQK